MILCSSREEGEEREREIEGERVGERVSWHANKYITGMQLMKCNKKTSILVAVEIKLSLGPKDQSKILI